MNRPILFATVVLFGALPLAAQELAPPPPAADAASGPGGGDMHARLLAMDTDHDGKWSKAEWLAGGRKERGFDMMDTNHDGYLTVDELKAGREKLRAMREAKDN